MSGAAARTGKDTCKEYKNIGDYSGKGSYVKRRTQYNM